MSLPGRELAPALLAAAFAGGCTLSIDESDRAPDERPDIASIADPVPRHEPKSKYGNPPTYVVHGKRYFTLDSAAGFVERGIASWYGEKFHGRRTSSGETYDMYAMTAAHKSLPLPTYVLVTNLDNGRSVTVRVNDRGPFHAGRVIDLSYTAALKLDVVREGTAPVEVRALEAGAPVVRPAASAGDIYVQAGAFAERSNARRMERRLAGQLANPVEVRAVEHSGRHLHRVWIGPMTSITEADEMLLELDRLGIDDARIVVE